MTVPSVRRPCVVVYDTDLTPRTVLGTGDRVVRVRPRRVGSDHFHFVCHQP
jgi:hypothetical protein